MAIVLRGNNTSTFSSSVSVGGTVTYDDVKEIDSVGIITARSGIKVSAGGVHITNGGLNVVGGGITFAAGPVVNNGSYIRGINNDGDPKIIGGYISGSNDLRLGELLYLTSTGLGINESSPLAKLHVKEGDSGLSAANANADTVFIENGANAGITIATPNTNTGYLIFADPDDDNVGQIIYRHGGSNANSMGFFVNANERVRITDSGTAIVTAGSIPANAGNETLYVMGEGHNGHGTSNTRSVVSFIGAITSNSGGAGVWMGARTNDNTAVIGTRTASGDLAFETYNGGWGERMRLTNTGKLGINVSSPDSTLEIRSLTTSNTQLKLVTQDNYSGTYPHAQISFEQSTGTELAKIKADVPSSAANQADLVFSTNFGGMKEDLRLYRTGNLEITDGNLIVANGHGIDFGSTTPDGTSPSSELLDDYEEGTWTPSFTSFTLGNGVITGQYTKIGNIVHVTFRLDCGSTTSWAGTVSAITGLPFSNALASNTGYLSASNPSNNWFGYTQHYATGTSTNYIQWITSTNIQAVGSNSIPFTWGSSTAMRFNMTYRVG